MKNWTGKFSHAAKNYLNTVFENDFQRDDMVVLDHSGWDDDGQGRFVKDVFIESDKEKESEKLFLVFSEDEDSYELYLIDRSGNEVWSKTWTPEEFKSAVEPKKKTELTL